MGAEKLQPKRGQAAGAPLFCTGSRRTGHGGGAGARPGGPPPVVFRPESRARGGGGGAGRRRFLPAVHPGGSPASALTSALTDRMLLSAGGRARPPGPARADPAGDRALLAPAPPARTHLQVPSRKQRRRHHPLRPVWLRRAARVRAAAVLAGVPPPLEGRAPRVSPPGPWIAGRDAPREASAPRAPVPGAQKGPGRGVRAAGFGEGESAKQARRWPGGPSPATFPSSPGPRLRPQGGRAVLPGATPPTGVWGARGGHGLRVGSRGRLARLLPQRTLQRWGPSWPYPNPLESCLLSGTPHA